MLTKKQQQTTARPFLKWAGGKGKLISQYLRYFPSNYKNYYESFLGGGAIFFHLLPKSAVLTDINSELITTYRCVRDKVEELIELLQKHASEHNPDYYYWMRENPGNLEIEQAARLIYLNKTCFNGLYRVNSQGKFNVPLGRYKNPKICDPDSLRLASKSLQFAEIKVSDFEYILNYAHSSDDFVYFDPPYHPISHTSYFTAYSRNAFTETDQKRLRDICEKLAIKGVKVMISNSDCLFIKNIYTEIGFKMHKISAARPINSNIKNRGAIYELLITSY